MSAKDVPDPGNVHEKPKEVGIWIRVSSEDQAQGESPEHHEYRARSYATQKEWKIVRVYDLSAVSGKTVAEHPECQAMLEDVAQKRITGLIFSKLARLARNTKELLEFAEYFQEHDADLISLQEAIDTSNPIGRFFYTLIAGMAQWEREEIADRVKASVNVRAQLGKPLGGVAPLGYRWHGKQLVPDPDEVPIRRKIFELFVERKRFKTVARELTQAGYRTRTGSAFGYTTVRRILDDPIVIGRRRTNYSTNRRSHRELKPESEWVWTEVEPIISEELWNQAQGILVERRAGRRPARKAKQLFSGLTYCHCGTKMYKGTKHTEVRVPNLLQQDPYRRPRTAVRQSSEAVLP